MEGNILLRERSQAINNKMKLHILGVPMNKLGNWLIVYTHCPQLALHVIIVKADSFYCPSGDRRLSHPRIAESVCKAENISVSYEKHFQLPVI